MGCVMFKWNRPPPQAIFPVLYALCAGVLIWPLLGSQPPVDQAGAQTFTTGSPQGQNVQDAPHFAELAASLTALRAEHKEVKLQLQVLEKRVAELAAQQAAPAADAERHDDNGAAAATNSDRHDDGQMQQFALLEEQFYAEPIDADWAADMQRDFHVIESRLEEFTAATTFIDHRECRSGSCRVEFVHERSVPPLLPALIASPRNTHVSLKTVVQDGKPKTIALYHK